MDLRKRQNLRRITESIIGLPTLPTVVTRIISLVDNPQTPLAEIARVVSTDQALTAKILKLANSAFFGFRRRISTVNLAVVVLGFETVKSIGLSMSVLERFSRGIDLVHFDRQQFWEHSIGVAVTAGLLAGKLNYRARKAEAFSAGILHDIGKLVLSQYFHGDFTRTLELAHDNGLQIRVAEERMLGVTHAEVGGWLAEKWNLPQQLVEVIAYHHDPSRASEHGRGLASLVHIANAICRHQRIGTSGDEQGPDLDESALRFLGLWSSGDVFFEEQLPEIEAELRVELEKADIFSSIVKGEPVRDAAEV